MSESQMREFMNRGKKPIPPTYNPNPEPKVQKKKGILDLTPEEIIKKSLEYLGSLDPKTMTSQEANLLDKLRIQHRNGKYIYYIIAEYTRILKIVEGK